MKLCNITLCKKLLSLICSSKIPTNSTALMKYFKGYARMVAVKAPFTDFLLKCVLTGIFASTHEREARNRFTSFAVSIVLIISIYAALNAER